MFPSLFNASCAFGVCIIADTGKHPVSLRVVRSATAARVPPHCPAEYVTVYVPQTVGTRQRISPLGSNENVDDPK